VEVAGDWRRRGAGPDVAEPGERTPDAGARRKVNRARPGTRRGATGFVLRRTTARLAFSNRSARRILLGAVWVFAQTAMAVAMPPATNAPAARVAVPAAVVAQAAPAWSAPDSSPPRPKPVELSAWYGRRLAIHRAVAYGTLPVFALQWIAGNRLYADSRTGAPSPTWAKTTHRVGATTLAAGFTINTVTGAWNWWDTRAVPDGRVRRTLHALSMLTADAAFTYAGAKLSDEAEQSADKRRLHRTIALSAMGLTTASALAMFIWNR